MRLREVKSIERGVLHDLELQALRSNRTSLQADFALRAETRRLTLHDPRFARVEQGFGQMVVFGIALAPFAGGDSRNRQQRGAYRPPSQDDEADLITVDLWSSVGVDIHAICRSISLETIGSHPSDLAPDPMEEER